MKKPLRRCDERTFVSNELKYECKKNEKNMYL